MQHIILRKKKGKLENGITESKNGEEGIQWKMNSTGSDTANDSPRSELQ